MHARSFWANRNFGSSDIPNFCHIYECKPKQFAHFITFSVSRKNICWFLFASFKPFLFTLLIGHKNEQKWTKLHSFKKKSFFCYEAKTKFKFEAIVQLLYFVNSIQASIIMARFLWDMILLWPLFVHCDCLIYIFVIRIKSNQINPIGRAKHASNGVIVTAAEMKPRAVNLSTIHNGKNKQTT